ncbi:MAG: S-adenosylmethionine synthetase N-terminal domain-containing protein, partial [Sweet potato little leaf phytoplasma]|nr:S-adenosylmethionine synthetase N-terminal domain-containing protein [Sweet potato little leaf phytoplasma]
MQKFTVESVTQGHPDKIADQISDVLLDAYLKQDSNAKVAIETIVTKNKIILCGEIKSSINLEKHGAMLHFTLERSYDVACDTCSISVIQSMR